MDVHLPRLFRPWQDLPTPTCNAPPRRNALGRDGTDLHQTEDFQAQRGQKP